mgnify:FL=1|tara:strand:- start:451 stop:1164 length:714 start_codon:yes stop_codon:yes gene_type:complete
MALPKVETPTYELTLPSRDEVLQFRPFLVKEEKVLLMANEEGKQISTAIKEVIKACTFNKWDVDTAPLFDVEYVFLKIRAKSVGEIQKLKLLCPDDKETYAEAEIDLSEVDVQVDDNHSNKILVDEERNLGVVFKYPNVEMMDYDFGEEGKVNMKMIMEMIIDCVDHVFEGDKLYPGKDVTRKEMIDFFDSMNPNAFVKIQDFFLDMPRLRHTVEVENPKTGVKSNVVLQGVRDFFA